MKIHAFVSFLLLTVALPGAESPEKPRFRDAATHEQLVKALRYAEKNDPMKKLKPTEGDDPSKVNLPQNLLDQSDVISFGGVATLVPKRAILAAPPNLKDRVGIKPGVRIVGWMEFQTLNRGWITTVEVSRTQAEGNQAIADETRERIGKSSNLVVATYKGGPISVLPLKETAQPANPAKP